MFTSRALTRFLVDGRSLTSLFLAFVVVFILIKKKRFSVLNRKKLFDVVSTSIQRRSNVTCPLSTVSVSIFSLTHHYLSLIHSLSL